MAEIYAKYRPAKLKVGRKHISMALEEDSLASVAPPDIIYELAIPHDPINSGQLSALQLEFRI